MSPWPLAACAVALTLASGAAGLRRGELVTLAGAPHSPPGSYRQYLTNNADMQYLVNLKVGGTGLMGLPDTGSYDFVVFGKKCKGCGRKGTYNSATSLSFVGGPRSREQNYGSGSCVAQDGYDSFSVGPFSASDLPMWEATHCDLPLLKTGGFDAVVGLGPPGHAKHLALNMLDEIRGIEGRYKRSRKELPENIVKAKEMFLEDVLDTPKKPSLLDSIGVTVFSVCYGRRPGSPGWIVWNDTRPAASLPAPVFGGYDWSTRLKDAALVSLGQDRVPLGCTPEPCHAVLDSGTSLLGVPSYIYQAVLAELSRDDAPDCSDLRKFPDLVFNLGGNELRFPPEAYIGDLEGYKSELLGRFLHSDRLGAGSLANIGGGLARCQLLLLDNGNSTAENGHDEFVLGAPFFREYYTTFDVGRPTLGRERKIYFTPASDQCQPAERAHQGFVYNRHRGPVLPRRVDASQLRLPSRWLRRPLLASEG